MLQETDQIQSYQKLGRTAAGALAEPGGDLLVGVGALTAGPLRHQLLKGGTVPRDRWIESGIVHRPHIDDGSHLGRGLTQHRPGTLLLIRDPLHAPRAPRGTLDGTVVIDAAATGSKTVATHEEP